jgi:uncharacterized membrane protein YdjX (TVP38/TMEM64 family)
MRKDDKAKKKIIIAIAVFFILMFMLSLIALPYISLISDPEAQNRFKTWGASLGVRGWFLVLGIQVAQIVVAFIPGEPVEILAGVLYGGVGGLFLCLLGCAIASSGIFLLSKKFGTPLVAELFKKSKLDTFAFLKDSRKLETIVFILFLIPGTPKDMLTYVVGTSPMKVSQFLVISIFARIPSVVSSTFLGSTIRQGKWEIAVAIFIATAVFGISGITYQEKIIRFCKRIGRRVKGVGCDEERL